MKNVRCIPVLITFLSVFISLQLSAQFYNLGQDPASYKWRQIQTEKFRLIYPENFEQQAQRMMNILESSAPKVELSLNHKTRQMPFIFHNGQITPNAFTVWTPRRIELYTTPPQNCYSQDWMEQLAIHEFRHAVQMDMTNVGLTNVFYYIFGEMAPSVVTGLFVPMWFMEGDAVCTETALSHSGRGRTPSFEMELRAQVLEKGRYSYNKAIMGSYRDFVPDHYVLGYQMVANTRKEFGAQVWANTMDFTGSLPIFINPFNQALKVNTGMKKRKLYYHTMDEMKAQWEVQQKNTTFTPFHLITPQVKNKYIRYKYPHYLNDSTVIAERVSLEDVSQFVAIDHAGNESVVCTPGFFSSEVFSVRTGSALNKPGTLTLDNLSTDGLYMVWTEKIADPRWQNRNYSVIKLYDFKKKEVETLTRKSRYFAPAINPDGTKILAVDIDETNQVSLVVLSRDSIQDTEKLIVAQFGEHIMTPAWSDDGKEIVYILLNGKGKQIRIYNIENKTDRAVFGPVYDEIAEPVFAGKHIFFTGSFSGIDNIYAVNPATQEVMQVTSSKYGAAHADVSMKRNKLLYSDYTANGYKVAEADIDPSSWKPIAQVTDLSPKLYQYLLPDEKGNIVDETTIPDNKYESRKYYKFSHLMKVHSWAPLYINYLTGEMKPGLSIMSQNDLSTATTVAGYDWDIARPTGRLKFSFIYEGWYPILSTDISIGKRTLYRTIDGNVESFTRDEKSFSGNVSLPLLFNQNEYYSQILTGATYNFLDISNYSVNDEDDFEGKFHLIGVYLKAAKFRKQAIRDVYPRLGFLGAIQYQSILGPNTHSGIIAALQMTGYLPGLFKNHGIKLYYGFQSINAQNSALTNLLASPRGIDLIQGYDGSVFRSTYKLPVCYPDFSVGSFIYMKSIKAALFFDSSLENKSIGGKDMFSYGTEISSELHFLRFLFPFEIGARIGQSSQKNFFAELIFDVNLSL
jgi:hypothetical protein